MHSAQEPSAPPPSKGANPFRGAKERDSSPIKTQGSIVSMSSGIGGEEPGTGVLSARERALKNNVKMDELDLMLEQDSAQLVGMKMEIELSQREQIKTSNKMLIAQRKEYDILRRTNTLKAKEESAWKDRVLQLQRLVQSGTSQQSKYAKEIEKLTRESTKNEMIIASELRSQKVIESMRERLQKEIANCRIDISSASYALDHLKHEYTATDLALISSRQEYGALTRQIKTLSRTAAGRSQQREKRMSQLHNIVDEADASRQKMEDSLALQSTILEQRETLRDQALSASAGVDEITGTRRPASGFGYAGSTPGGTSISAAAGGDMDPMDGVFFEVMFSDGSTDSPAKAGKVPYKRVLAMIDHYKNKELRKNKLEGALEELTALGKRLSKENISIDRQVKEKQERFYQLASNRQMYQEMDSKSSTLTTARKDCDEFVDRGRSLKLSIENLRATLPRLCTKLTNMTMQTVSVEKLPETLGRLDEEIIKTMKSIQATLLNEATNEDIAEAAETQGLAREEDSELEALLRLPGFLNLKDVVFGNLMKAKSDGSGKNVRIYVDSPNKHERNNGGKTNKASRDRGPASSTSHGQKTKKGGSNSETKDHQSTSMTSLTTNSTTSITGKKSKSSKTRKPEVQTLDRNMVKNISTLVVERDGPKAQLAEPVP